MPANGTAGSLQSFVVHVDAGAQAEARVRVARSLAQPQPVAAHLDRNELFTTIRQKTHYLEQARVEKVQVSEALAGLVDKDPRRIAERAP